MLQNVTALKGSKTVLSTLYFICISFTEKKGSPVP